MSTEAKASETQPSEAALESPIPLPRWARRGVALAAIAVGWGFIGWHNHFYFTPAVVALALGWSACVSTLYFLFRVGAAGADPEVEREDWWLETGEREELEREKRAVLKSIREIEFDHETGKLSDRDAQEMTQVFRGRAIEVMKALDATEGGDVRADIEREVRVRLEIERARKAAKKATGKAQANDPPGAAAAKKPKGGKGAARSATAINAQPAVDVDALSSATDATTEAATEAASEATNEATTEAATEAANDATEAASEAKIEATTAAATERSGEPESASSDRKDEALATPAALEAAEAASPSGSSSSEVSA